MVAAMLCEDCDEETEKVSWTREAGARSSGWETL
jgi:hypothetical protein